MGSGILKLSPAFKDYIWGGNYLKDFYNVNDMDRVAEAWVLSAHKDGISLVKGGEYDGKSFAGVLKSNGFEEEFPLLIKLIDAKSDLSVQVHPDDNYARKAENQAGKTEMWYVLDAEENAGIYCGFKEDITKDEFKESIENGTLTDKLSFIKVKKGDCFYIPSGTVHAICKGVLIAEIQQSSNVTYRVYDYLRKGADGKFRELHIDKALDVAKTVKYSYSPSLAKTDENGNRIRRLVDSKFFYSDEILSSGEYKIDTKNFVTVLITEGSGTLCGIPFGKFDCFYIEEGEKGVSLKGEFTALLSGVPKSK